MKICHSAAEKPSQRVQILISPPLRQQSGCWTTWPSTSLGRWISLDIMTSLWGWLWITPILRMLLSRIVGLPQYLRGYWMQHRQAAQMCQRRKWLLLMRQIRTMSYTECVGPAPIQVSCNSSVFHVPTLILNSDWISNVISLICSLSANQDCQALSKTFAIHANGAMFPVHTIAPTGTLDITAQAMLVVHARATCGVGNVLIQGSFHPISA